MTGGLRGTVLELVAIVGQSDPNIRTTLGPRVRTLGERPAFGAFGH
jgi:hypothetical protein